MKSLWIVSLVVICGFQVSCGFPAHPLSEKERKSDLNWMFSLFERNYGPVEYKESLHGVSLEDLKSKCLAEAEGELSHSQFMVLFQKCVHSLKDPHVSAVQMNSQLLPEQVQVAHLGFSTFRLRVPFQGRNREALRVMKFFVGSESPLSPVQPGDFILKVDGKDVDAVLREEIIPYMDLGQIESSLTVASLQFPLRSSLTLPLPEQKQVELLILRDGGLFTVMLPWVHEDSLAFNLRQEKKEEEQAQPAPPPSSPPQPPVAPSNESRETTKFAQNMSGFGHFIVGYDVLGKLFEQIQQPAMQVGRRVQFILENGFQFRTFLPTLANVLRGDALSEMVEKVLGRKFSHGETIVPFMPELGIPAFVVQDGQAESTSYLYIPLRSFPGDDIFVASLQLMFSEVNKRPDINGLVLDTIDNSGGSLIHGLRLANSLRRKNINFPSIQVRLNDNWFNSVRGQVAFGATVSEKAIAQNLLEKLEMDQQADLILSRPFSLRELDPFLSQMPKFQCEATGRCLRDDIKLVVLVNEMCVSMCDIFADSVKANDLGLVIGQKTMGGGGNVTQHGLSPISKMMVSLTESLILKTDGSGYIENNGIEPDIQVDMVLGRGNSFKEALDMAYLYFTDKLSPLPPVQEN